MTLRKANSPSQPSRKSRWGLEEETFFVHANAIMDGYHIRKLELEERKTLKHMHDKKSNGSMINPKPRPPYDESESFFKRESYFLLKHYLSDRKLEWVIREYVRKNCHPPDNLYFSGNRYHWGLIAIDNARPGLGPKRISKYAIQLEYAARNYVPPQFLIGFLYQINASARITKKLPTTSRDPSLQMTIPLQSERGVARK